MDVPPTVTSRSALRDDVVQTLRTRIIDGDLAGGERLNERDLSRRFEVSRVPIREALLILAGEGLVVIEPHVGATVTRLTRERVREIFEVRGALEPLGARLCAIRATPEDLTVMHDLVAGAQDAQRSSDIPGGADHNADFHELLFAASGNHLLKSMVPALNAMTRRLFRHTLPEHEEMMWSDHIAISTAIAMGDADHAAELTLRHLENTRRHTFRLFDIATP